MTRQAGIWKGLERRREELGRHAQNRGRRGVTMHTYQTTGFGSFVEPKVFPFQTGYSEEPAFSYGAVLNDTDTDGDPQEVVNGRFPRCSGMVIRWCRDGYGLYVGAWVGFTVDDVSYQEALATGLNWQAMPVDYVINHHMHFTAVGIKALAPGQMDAL